MCTCIASHTCRVECCRHGDQAKCVLCAQVTAHVSDAVSKGAKVLAGGKVPELPEPLSNGHFYSPTVLADATIDM
jgi:acyl-CoA reductase-like NAD-dependent aldehyde dehydrogenase